MSRVNDHKILNINFECKLSYKFYNTYLLLSIKDN